jgi:hypothetical protein
MFLCSQSLLRLLPYTHILLVNFYLQYKLWIVKLVRLLQTIPYYEKNPEAYCLYNNQFKHLFEKIQNQSKSHAEKTIAASAQIWPF